MSETDVQAIVAFCREHAIEARRMSKARLDAEDAWASGTAADHEEGRLMAERMSGRPVSRKSKAERQVLADRERAIAARYDRDAETFDAIERLLADRDAHVREAFMAGKAAHHWRGEWNFKPWLDDAERAEAAFAAFQARPSSGTGSGEKEQL